MNGGWQGGAQDHYALAASEMQGAQCPLALPRPQLPSSGSTQEAPGQLCHPRLLGHPVNTRPPPAVCRAPAVHSCVAGHILSPVLPPPPPPPLSPTDVPDQPGPYHRVSLKAVILSTSFPPDPVLPVPGPPDHTIRMGAQAPPPMELQCCGHKVGVTSETIQRDQCPTRDGHCCPGPAVGGRCALLLWVFS